MQKLLQEKRTELVTEFQSELIQLTKGLDVNFNIQKDLYPDLITIDFVGDDSPLFLTLLRNRYGIAPLTIENVKKNQIITGVVIDSGRVGFGLFLDIGLRKIRQIDGLLSLKTLRAQLADGERCPLKTIIRKYCLEDYIPLNIRVVNIDDETNRIKVELSDNQIENLIKIPSNPLKRLFLTKVSKKDVNQIIKGSKTASKIASVNRLNLASYELVCKLGINISQVVHQLKIASTTCNAKVIAPTEILLT